MVTGDQILAHLLGDYIFQSHWMATEKTKRAWPAVCHVITYSIGFWYLAPSLKAMAFILASHYFIDRYRLARYVIWLKNHVSPSSEIELVQAPSTGDASGPGGNVNQYRLVQYWLPWEECKGTGYPKETPAWMSVWLLIIADNALHLLCNGFALTYL